MSKTLSSVLKAKAKGGSKSLSEADVRAKSAITPEDVLALDGPTTGFLCRTTDNIYGIEFTAYTLRDPDSGTVLFSVEKPANIPYTPPSEDDDDSGRFVQYRFSTDFFKLKSLGATVRFRVGDQPVHNFRMIERHFFNKKVLKSFDFNFGFVIPDSENTCEHLYEIPKLSAADKEDMVARPYATKSDSFYFVDNKLVMHHKAEYAYEA